MDEDKQPGESVTTSDEEEDDGTVVRYWHIGAFIICSGILTVFLCGTMFIIDKINYTPPDKPHIYDICGYEIDMFVLQRPGESLSNFNKRQTELELESSKNNAKCLFDEIQKFNK